MEKQTDWYPALPADGVIEFPTMGGQTFRVQTRHDGNYEVTLVNANNVPIGEWHLSPHIDIAICLRKTPEQAKADENVFIDKLNAILGMEVFEKQA